MAETCKVKITLSRLIRQTAEAIVEIPATMEPGEVDPHEVYRFFEADEKWEDDDTWGCEEGQHEGPAVSAPNDAEVDVSLVDDDDEE